MQQELKSLTPFAKEYIEGNIQDLCGVIDFLHGYATGIGEENCYLNKKIKHHGQSNYRRS